MINQPKPLEHKNKKEKRKISKRQLILTAFIAGIVNLEARKTPIGPILPLTQCNTDYIKTFEENKFGVSYIPYESIAQNDPDTILLQASKVEIAKDQSDILEGCDFVVLYDIPIDELIDSNEEVDINITINPDSTIDSDKLLDLLQSFKAIKSTIHTNEQGDRSVVLALGYIRTFVLNGITKDDLQNYSLVISKKSTDS